MRSTQIRFRRRGNFSRFFVLAFGFERWIAMASTGPVFTVRILVLLLQGKVATI